MVSERAGACDVAFSLADLGYHVIPLTTGSKAARDKNWPTLRLGPDDIQDAFRRDEDPGIGLLLGTEVAKGVFLTAVDVDIDDQLMIDNIRLAFPSEPPAKRGKKGITYIARMTTAAKKRNFRRKDPVTGATLQVVELLATGQQTVIPPSFHPEGMQYQWIGPPLLDFEPADLPLLDAKVVFEIELAVKDPTSNIFLLNTMIWNGTKGGGDVHNSTLTAVASLVGHGWDEDSIWARVNRATSRVVLDYEESYDWPEWEGQVRQMVKDAVAKGYATRSKKEKIHKTVANWFINEHSNKLCYNRDGRVMIYDKGAYLPLSSYDLRHIIATKYVEPESVSLIASDWRAISDTISDTTPPFPVHKRKRRVCLKNGTFDLDDGTLYGWSPDDFLISRTEFDYDPKAVCPTYDDFMLKTFTSEEEDATLSIQCFEEFVSHTLFECLDFQKFLVIKGVPSTGKSTLLKLVSAMHGSNAVSAVPVHEFGNERYRTAMTGCLVNLVSEVQATSHAVDDFLKAVTSGDSVQIRYLYEEPRLVQLPTRMIIACNEMFRVRDTSGAIERRMLFLSCNNPIPEDEQDPDLKFKLVQELPGIFNRLVAAWGRLRERKRFIPPTSQVKHLEEFTLENNHVLQWLQERTHQGQVLLDPATQMNGHAGAATEIGILYLDFSEWMKLNGFKTLSSIGFGAKLSQIKTPPGVNLKSSVKWVGGKATRVREISLLSEGRY